MYDYHIHSTFSPDSRQTIEEICEMAVALGLKGIAITDHIDWDFPKEDPNEPEWSVNYNQYIEKINFYTEKYRKQLSVTKGIELGMLRHLTDRVEKYIQSHKFDFIIASIHAADNCDIKYQRYHDERTQKEAYMIYLNELLYMVKNFKSYSVVGHLDLIVRYGEYIDKKMILSEYGDILDTILKEIIFNNKGIEVNTSGYKYGLNTMHPNIDIIRRYKELGGEIITTGSDAHTTEYISYKFEETYEMLRSIGFRYITIFKDLKPEFIKI